MKNILINTFREIIRGRFASLVFLFVLVEIFGIFFLNTLSLNQSKFIVVDFGLSFIELVGLFSILFLGNRLLSREFEEKTIYLTLSRPIPRGQIIFGKFFGFSLSIFLLSLALFVVLLGLMLFFSVVITPIVWISFLGILLKLFSLVAIILLFSIFLSSGVATFGALAVYIIGHGGYMLLEYALVHQNSMMLRLGQGILYFFPNFQALNFKNMVHLTTFPHFSHFLFVIGFSLLYIAIVLFISQYIFSKKSFDNI